MRAYSASHQAPGYSGLVRVWRNHPIDSSLQHRSKPAAPTLRPPTSTPPLRPPGRHGPVARVRRPAFEGPVAEVDGADEAVAARERGHEAVRRHGDVRERRRVRRGPVAVDREPQIARGQVRRRRDDVAVLPLGRRVGPVAVVPLLGPDAVDAPGQLVVADAVAGLDVRLVDRAEPAQLDDADAGINPTLINGIIDRLIKVNQDFGITLLVIEHNMRVIMQLAESIFCLAHGKMLANGTPDEIKNDKRVIDAYLGAQ